MDTSNTPWHLLVEVKYRVHDTVAAVHPSHAFKRHV
jgi:hypothetical protein